MKPTQKAFVFVFKTCHPNIHVVLKNKAKFHWAVSENLT